MSLDLSAKVAEALRRKYSVSSCTEDALEDQDERDVTLVAEISPFSGTTQPPSPLPALPAKKTSKWTMYSLYHLEPLSPIMSQNSVTCLEEETIEPKLVDLRDTDAMDPVKENMENAMDPVKENMEDSIIFPDNEQKIAASDFEAKEITASDFEAKEITAPDFEAKEFAASDDALSSCSETEGSLRSEKSPSPKRKLRTTRHHIQLKMSQFTGPLPISVQEDACGTPQKSKKKTILSRLPGSFIHSTSPSATSPCNSPRNILRQPGEYPMLPMYTPSESIYGQKRISKKQKGSSFLVHDKIWKSHRTHTPCGSPPPNVADSESENAENSEESQKSASNSRLISAQQQKEKKELRERKQKLTKLQNSVVAKKNLNKRKTQRISDSETDFSGHESDLEQSLVDFIENSPSSIVDRGFDRAKCVDNDGSSVSDVMFKVYVQYLISVCIDPDFARLVLEIKDVYFMEAISYIENVCNTLLEFLVSSVAWTAQFTKYPKLRTNHFVQIDSTICEACARTGRIAKVVITLSGQSYDHVTFAESGEVKLSQDSQPKEFHVGKFCTKRCQMYHEVYHYRYSLYQAIKLAVEAEVTRNEDQDPPSILAYLLDKTLWLNKLKEGFDDLSQKVETSFCEDN